jgi:hypothetical protein
MKILTAVLTLIALAAWPAAADMTGSTGEILGPSLVNPGETALFEFDIANGSPDGEWTSEVRFVFPETFHIQDGWYDDLGQGWSFAFSASGTYLNVAHFTDVEDDLQGEIEPGTGGLFYVLLEISSNTPCGEHDIRWKQLGDGTGAEPHFVFEDIVYLLCYTPSEEGTWTSVKGLY